MIATYAAGESGASKAARDGATVVVVDAYRASTTISVLISKGARVVPVASIEEAAAYPGADYRVGECDSAKVPGFDFGNSPTEIERAEIERGATIVLSSTNGTRILAAAFDAPTILTGAFVNARAIADNISTDTMNDKVAVIGCGWRGHRSSEDESASGAILQRLEERGATLDDRAERIVQNYLTRPEKYLRNNTAAKRLKHLNYAHDLDICLALNTIPVVPRLVNGAFIAL